MSKNGIFHTLVGFSVLSIITAAIGFVVVPISTRLIDTEALGKINMLQSVVAILMPCMCLGLDHGYIRKYSEINSNEAKSLFTASFIISISTACSLSVISLIAWRKISNSIVGEERMDVILLLLISTIAYIIERYLQLQYRMENNVSKYSQISLLFIFANKVLYVLTAFCFKQYIQLIYIMIISEIMVSLLCLIQHRNKFTRRRVHFSEVIDSIRFGIPIMGAMVISLVNQYIPKNVLRQFYGYSDVGIYSTAVTLASVITVLQTGFTLVWTPFVYENYKKNKDEEINRLQETLVASLTIIASGIIVLQNVLVYIIGQKYREITQYLPVLLLVPVLASLGEITGIGINIAKKTKYHLINNACTVFITYVSSIYIIPSLGGLGAAISSVFGAITLFFLRTIESKEYYMPVKNYRMIISCIVLLVFLSMANILFSEKMELLYGIFGVVTFIEIALLYKPVMGIFSYLKECKK